MTQINLRKKEFLNRTEECNDVDNGIRRLVEQSRFNEGKVSFREACYCFQSTNSYQKFCDRVKTGEFKDAFKIGAFEKGGGGVLVKRDAYICWVK